MKRERQPQNTPHNMPISYANAVALSPNPSPSREGINNNNSMVSVSIKWKGRYSTPLSIEDVVGALLQEGGVLDSTSPPVYGVLRCENGALNVWMGVELWKKIRRGRISPTITIGDRNGVMSCPAIPDPPPESYVVQVDLQHVTLNNILDPVQTKQHILMKAEAEVKAMFGDEYQQGRPEEDRSSVKATFKTTRASTHIIIGLDVAITTVGELQQHRSYIEILGCACPVNVMRRNQGGKLEDVLRTWPKRAGTITQMRRRQQQEAHTHTQTHTNPEATKQHEAHPIQAQNNTPEDQPQDHNTPHTPTHITQPHHGIPYHTPPQQREETQVNQHLHQALEHNTDPSPPSPALNKTGSNNIHPHPHSPPPEAHTTGEQHQQPETVAQAPVMQPNEDDIDLRPQTPSNNKTAEAPTAEAAVPDPSIDTTHHQQQATSEQQQSGLENNSSNQNQHQQQQPEGDTSEQITAASTDQSVHTPAQQQQQQQQSTINNQPTHTHTPQKEKEKKNKQAHTTHTQQQPTPQEEEEEDDTTQQQQLHTQQEEENEDKEDNHVAQPEAAPQPRQSERIKQLKAAKERQQEEEATRARTMKERLDEWKTVHNKKGSVRKQNPRSDIVSATMQKRQTLAQRKQEQQQAATGAEKWMKAYKA